MTGFIVRRLVLAIPVLFGILTITFILVHLIPGDPCHAILGERASPAVCQEYIRHNGLDQPITSHLAVYITHAGQGDFGTSLRYGRRVVDLLIERMAITIELGMCAMIFATLVGIPLGILSAYRHNSAIDVGTMIGANIGVSMPVFWLGLILSYI